MPPGKKPTSARAIKSKQADIELSLDDQNNTVVLELENKDQELETQQGAESSSEPKVEEEDEDAAAQQINQEIITNSMEEVEGTVVDSKEEATNVEAVIADHVNVESVEQSGVVEEEGERMEGLDKSDDANMEDDDDAIEGKTVDDEQKQKEGIDGVPVAEQHSAEEEIAAAQINDAEALEDNSNVLVLNEGRDGEGEGEGDGKNKEDNEIDEHPAEFIHNHITDRKKEKDLEIFIGRLDKEAVEDDLIKVFGKFGEIREAKIVRKSTTNKSKGFAFIRYATVEQAKNALSASKDGIEVRGKHVKMSASEGNDTLYMGNICKSWTKERVLGALKSYGIENIAEMHLPDDPRKGGKIKGFALLEFSTHSDAMEAIQRLRKPDVVFGRDISAKVAFAQTPLRPNQDVLSELKTVYLEGLADDWNKGKVNELCKQYGELVEIKLSRNIGTKSKDFGFITFTSQEGALACVEGINNAHIGEEVKVKASIAKPHSKGQLQKQDTHGSFKVKEKGMAPSTKEESERENKVGSSKMKGHAKSKQSKRKGKTVAEDKGKTLSESEIGGGGKPKKSRTVTEDQPKLERKNRKRKNLHLNAEGRGTPLELKYFSSTKFIRFLNHPSSFPIMTTVSGLSSPLGPPVCEKDEKALQFIEEMTKNTNAVQEKVLREILSRNAQTEYLQRFKLGGASDRETFKSKVPVVTYEDLEQDIQRIANGDKSSIFSSHPISEFFTSSGTSAGERKLIPMIDEEWARRQLLQSLVMPVMKLYIPDLDKGKGLYFLFVKAETKTPSGLLARPVLTSCFMSDQFKARPYDPYNVYTSPNEAILCPDSFQSMYTQMLCGLLNRDQVLRIGAIFASGLLRAIRFLQLNWKLLVHDIETGTLNPKITDPSIRECIFHLLQPNTELAHFIAKKCSAENWEGILKRIWPNTKYLDVIVTGAMAQYIPTLDYYSGGLPQCCIVYASSECSFGLNLNPMSKPSEVSYTIMPNMAYFEFLPHDQAEPPFYDESPSRLVDLADVELGKEYELVITTFPGLCRYRVGDILQVTGFHNSAPGFKFVRRKNVLLSIDSDKTNESELQSAIESASLLLREFNTSVVDYTSYADTNTIPGHYAVYWELMIKDPEKGPTREVLDRCCLAMEESMNSVYRQGRVADNSIGPLEIRVVKNGTFEELMDYAISRGVSINQYKVPRCVSFTPTVEILDARVISSHFSPATPNWTSERR